MQHLKQVITLARNALGLHPQQDSDRASSAKDLFDQYNKHGSVQDLDKAIVLEREALDLRPKELPDRASSLVNLATYLSTRYSHSGLMQDLEEAIGFDREALELRPKGHPSRSTSLTNLADSLHIRYRQLGGMQDLEEVIGLDREALELCPKGHPDRSSCLSNLAAHLATRYGQLSCIQDLQEAIVFGQEALELSLEGDLNRHKYLSNLSLSLLTRYNHLGSMQDLEEAIILTREALSLMKGHPNRGSYLSNLAIHLSTRYRELGGFQDLEEAIALSREALELRLREDPDRAISLSNLAIHLSARYGQLGDMQDLEEAVVLERGALELRPEGHPDRYASFLNLAKYLSTRYDQLGGMQDLQEAIGLERGALELCRQGHPERHLSLDHLSVSLLNRYRQLGDIQDLGEAISLEREVLGLCPTGHPARFSCLSHLALHLSARYRQLGGLQDLEEAIVLNREVLELRPKGDPNYSSYLNALANRLLTRYHHVGDTQDLEGAILLNQEALELCPTGHPNYFLSLDNLATSLYSRYTKVGGVQDLEQAIVLGQEALELCSEGGPFRAVCLDDLADHLSTRYRDSQPGDTHDLEVAIALQREALELQPQGHPYRSQTLHGLARNLQARFMNSRNIEDQEEMFSLYVRLSRLSQMVSFADVCAAKDWVELAEEFKHPTLLQAYETTLRLLIHHLATLPSSPQSHAVLKERTSSIAVDAFAACLRSNAFDHAVELLEQGRTVYWNQLIRLRSPMHPVMESGSEGNALATEFTQLATRIRNALSSSSLGDSDQDELLWKLNLRLQQIVTNIRALPGLSNFLLPPLFSDLQRAAREGPVIILNASQYSCDALIVFFDRDPVHIPLQIKKSSVRVLSTQVRNLAERAKEEDAVTSRELMTLLREVWDRIVGPIVDVLQTTVSHGSRIWWCPTADFSLLPLHAAGPFRTGHPSLAKIYISSYTPTLSSLIRAREGHSPSDSSHEKSFLAIGDAAAPGATELHSVGLELDSIAHLVEGRSVFTRIEGEDARIARVVEAFAKSDWVHLACHGLPNPHHPFESAFALHDGRFTIQTIMGCHSQHLEFAYLSACRTTVGDEESPDEVIHLAAAMQFVGFRSVIGTMWSVDDGAANTIASMFYKHVVDDEGRLDYTRAALALNKTMNTATLEIPFLQKILYVHIGV